MLLRFPPVTLPSLQPSAVFHFPKPSLWTHFDEIFHLLPYLIELVNERFNVILLTKGNSADIETKKALNVGSGVHACQTFVE